MSWLNYVDTCIEEKHITFMVVVWYITRIETNVTDVTALKSILCYEKGGLFP